MAVQSLGIACPTEGSIVPKTAVALVAVGAAKRTEGMVLEPDWELILGLCGGLFGVVAVVLVALHAFRLSAWGAGASLGDGKRSALPNDYRLKALSTQLNAFAELTPPDVKAGAAPPRLLPKGGTRATRATKAQRAARKSAAVVPGPPDGDGDEDGGGEEGGGVGVLLSQPWVTKRQFDVERWDEGDLDPR